MLTLRMMPRRTVLSFPDTLHRVGPSCRRAVVVIHDMYLSFFSPRTLSAASATNTRYELVRVWVGSSPPRWPDPGEKRSRLRAREKAGRRRARRSQRGKQRAGWGQRPDDDDDDDDDDKYIRQAKTEEKSDAGDAGKSIADLHSFHLPHQIRSYLPLGNIKSTWEIPCLQSLAINDMTTIWVG